MLLVIIYLAFISLGLPDSLLGAAWPSIYSEFGIPVSSAGILSMIIAVGTIISSITSGRLIYRLGTGKVVVLSALSTAIAIFGFSTVDYYPQFFLWAIPYGLGAGSVDAALNCYVALHYKKQHMNWLHCMWGFGATLGPRIMEYALSENHGWAAGYRYVALIQFVLAIFLFLSLPLWKQQSLQKARCNTFRQQPLSLKKVLQLPGAKSIMACCFCYCAAEQTIILWASSYLALCRGFSAETAAGYSSMFFIGITVGRALCGFAAMRLDDAQLIRIGEMLASFGIVALLLSDLVDLSLFSLAVLGLGCAPIYPSILHAAPSYFGSGHSQFVIGVQMASAYAGTCLMPLLFGILANRSTTALLPFYLIILFVFMAVNHNWLEKISNLPHAKTG